MRRKQHHMVIFASAAIMALAILAAGCGNSGSQQSEVGLTSPQSATAGWAAGMVIPSLSELTKNLELTPEQSGQMEKALAAFQSAHDARREQMTRNRENRGQFGNKGDRGFRGVAGPGPGQGFLASCSDFLEAKQFASLCTLMAEQRDANREKMRQEWQNHRTNNGKRELSGRGEGRGRFFSEFADELNLSDRQLEAIQKIFTDSRETMREFRQDQNRGTDRTARREQFRTMRDQMHEQIEAILTESQLAQWEQLREHRQSDRQTDRQERQAENMAERIGFLSDILNLSDGQKSQVVNIMESTHDRVTAHFDNFDRDNPPDEALRDQVKQLRNDAQTQIRALLNEEQAIKFDALSELRQGPGGPPGLGFGRGPGMRRFH